jgi:hypothetical protein
MSDAALKVAEKFAQFSAALAPALWRLFQRRKGDVQKAMDDIDSIHDLIDARADKRFYGRSDTKPEITVPTKRAKR